jgi:hypothetical protein
VVASVRQAVRAREFTVEIVEAVVLEVDDDDVLKLLDSLHRLGR